MPANSFRRNRNCFLSIAFAKTFAIGLQCINPPDKMSVRETRSGMCGGLAMPMNWSGRPREKKCTSRDAPSDPDSHPSEETAGAAAMSANEVVRSVGFSIDSAASRVVLAAPHDRHLLHPPTRDTPPQRGPHALSHCSPSCSLPHQHLSHVQEIDEMLMSRMRSTARLPRSTELFTSRRS